MHVETKQASLATLAVTIQALHVNAKQMTLAVFRQLPQARAYKDDGTLAEGFEYWGLVRYEIKDQGSLWLVAGRDGALYRCDTRHGHMPVEFKRNDLSYARSMLAEYEGKREKARQYSEWKAAGCVGGYMPWVCFTSDDEASLGHWREEIPLRDAAIVQAQTAARSHDVLMALPQLFIAV